MERLRDSSRPGVGYHFKVLTFRTLTVVLQRRHFSQATTLDESLEEQAKRLRKEAQGTQPGVKRDLLIRRARQVETAAHMRDWVTSPALQPPE
jgi:hypothetical protein